MKTCRHPECQLQGKIQYEGFCSIDHYRAALRKRGMQANEKSGTFNSLKQFLNETDKEQD